MSSNTIPTSISDFNNRSAGVSLLNSLDYFKGIDKIFPFTMPMIFVVGVFYPIETMPWII